MLTNKRLLLIIFSLHSRIIKKGICAGMISSDASSTRERK
jgi:hypothetical protein